jgi:KAT8 regulatory NSL complex subunit 2
MITKEKLIRLKGLYVDQFLRLQHVLKEKRKTYLQSIKKEKETLSSIHDQSKESPRERKLYEKFKALNHYHKRYGPEAILRRKYIEKRTNASEVTNKNIPKCHYIEGGVKCLEKSLPCMKYCKKHVLEDKKQVLFKACGIEKSGIVCQEPVVNVFEDASCVLHIPIPSPRVYCKRKYESETEDEIDVKIEDIKEEPTVVVMQSNDEVQEIQQPIPDENNITIVHETILTQVKDSKSVKKSPDLNTTTEIEVTVV